MPLVQLCLSHMTQTWTKSTPYVATLRYSSVKCRLLWRTLFPLCLGTRIRPRTSIPVPSLVNLFPTLCLGTQYRKHTLVGSLHVTNLKKHYFNWILKEFMLILSLAVNVSNIDCPTKVFQFLFCLEDGERVPFPCLFFNFSFRSQSSSQNGFT